MTQRRVWIVNESGHNYSAAEKYGELRRFSEGLLNIFQPDRIVGHFAYGVALAREGDYLLISGSPILNAIALWLWLQRFDEANVLQWNAKTREYELTKLNTEDMGHALDKALTRV